MDYEMDEELMQLILQQLYGQNMQMEKWDGGEINNEVETWNKLV